MNHAGPPSLASLRSPACQLSCLFTLLIGCLFCVLASPARTRAELLTNAAQVLSLSAERAAQKIPVHVKGVVTAAEPGWAGKFFIQDETKGVFIANRSEFRAD